MKQFITLAAFAGSVFYVNAQSSNFILIKEIPKIFYYVEPAKFYAHDSGVYIRYFTKPSMQMLTFDMDITSSGEAVDIFEENSSERGTVLSKLPYLDFGDANNGLYLLQDPNSKESIYAEIYDRNGGGKPKT
jgi:hypothetical protein